MKFLRKFNEDRFPHGYELTDDEFRQAWDYFCFDVFNKKRRTLFNKIIADAIEYIDFIEPKGHKFTSTEWEFNLAQSLNPYYGIAISLGSFSGMSYEFQKTVNDDTYLMSTCAGWRHLFKSAIDDIGWRNSFGKKEHGYPYYQYSLNLAVVDGWDGMSKEEVLKLIKTPFWGIKSGEGIPQYLKKVIELVAESYNVDLNISVQSYTDRCDDKRGCPFEIRLIDLDFVPKESIIQSNNKMLDYKFNI